jgi:hypothetical protein
MMRKGIVFVLVAAVLLLGGAAALFESITVNTGFVSIFDPKDPGGNVTPLGGDPLPDGKPL